MLGFEPRTLYMQSTHFTTHCATFPYTGYKAIAVYAAQLGAKFLAVGRNQRKPSRRTCESPYSNPGVVRRQLYLLYHCAAEIYEINP